MPDTAKLKAMAARFAPVDLTVDLSALPATERRALAKLVEAARVMDALFLRQVWAGNESMLLGLLHDDTPLGRARLHYFLTNKGPWSRLDHDEAFVPGAPAKPAGANFYPAGATKAAVERWIRRAAARRARGSHRLLHDHPARAGRRVRGGALQPGVPGRARAGGGAAARGGGPDHAAHAEGLPDGARRRLSQQRLLRERSRLDGARGLDRADHRALRGVRGRLVRVQGGVRGLRHRA